MHEFLLKVFIKNGKEKPTINEQTMSSFLQDPQSIYEIYADGTLLTTPIYDTYDEYYVCCYGISLNRDIDIQRVEEELIKDSNIKVYNLNRVQMVDIIWQEGEYQLLEDENTSTFEFKRVDEGPIHFEGELIEIVNYLLFEYLAKKYVFPNPQYSFSYDVEYEVKWNVILIRVKPIPHKIKSIESLLRIKPGQK